MKQRHSLPFLTRFTIAATLFGCLATQSWSGSPGCGLSQSGSTTLMVIDPKLEVRLAENGGVRISWNESNINNSRLQVSTNCVDWTDVSSASSPFFAPLNTKKSSYYRIVFEAPTSTVTPPVIDLPPGDFGIIGMLGGTDESGVIDRGIFGLDENPGPDLLWEDSDGDQLVDQEELRALSDEYDILKGIINHLRGVDGKSVPIPIEWLEDILDRIALSQTDGNTGPGVGLVVSVNPALGVDDFRNRLEHGPGMHDTVHCIVGGTMCSARSSNDPVFFSHHANLDKFLEGEKQDLLIAVVDFSDDLSGIVSSMLHDSSMAVIRKLGGEVNGGGTDPGQDGYPVLVHGIAAADSPIEGFWVSTSISVDALAREISAASLHNNGAFLPWHRGHVSPHNNGEFLPWHRGYITLPDDLGPPGGALQEKNNPVPALITNIWTNGSGTNIQSELEWLVDHLWHDEDRNLDDPARMVMLDTGPINLGSLGSGDASVGLDVGPVNLVMRNGAGNAMGRQGEVYFFHRENNDKNLSRMLHDTAMACIRKINAAPPNGGEGNGGRVVVRAASLQEYSDDGSDPILGGVIYRDRENSSPNIPEQFSSEDNASESDIGLVLIDPLDKSSTKITKSILNAAESLAKENVVIFLDKAATGDRSDATAVAGPFQQVFSLFGIGSEHWPQPGLQGEEVGPIFMVVKQQGNNMNLDFSWEFPQGYDALRQWLDYSEGLSDGEHLIIIDNSIIYDNTLQMPTQGGIVVGNPGDEFAGGLNSEILDDGTIYDGTLFMPVQGGIVVGNPGDEFDQDHSPDNKDSFMKLGDIKGE